jgi:hypothetical protein
MEIHRFIVGIGSSIEGIQCSLVDVESWPIACHCGIEGNSWGTMDPQWMIEDPQRSPVFRQCSIEATPISPVGGQWSIVRTGRMTKDIQ